MAECPEPLEKIFQQVEEESARRAQEHASELLEASDSFEKADSAAAAKKAKARRRGSISISRIGQFSEDYKTSQGPPTPNRVPTIASHSPFYQSQIANDSTASFASGASGLSGEHAHTEDDNHVTQVYQIAGRQTISKKVGGMLPRRLSRARSANVMAAGDSNLVIGVSVQEATHESAEDGDHSRGASVHAPGGLRNQASRATMAGSTPASSSGWVAKATKGFTQKFRRKSKLPSSAPSSYGTGLHPPR